MKKIDIIYKVCCLASLLFVFSCNESEDIITGDAREGGVIVRKDYSSAKITGLPDAESGEISFREVEVEYDLRVRSGAPDDIASYTIVKTLIQYGIDPEDESQIVLSETEVEVETVNELPYSISYTTIEDVLSGFNVEPEMVRIGDQVRYSVILNHVDGRELTASPTDGTLTVTINCLSDLAGVYSAVAKAANKNITAEYDIEVVELAPGQYYITPTSADLFFDRGFVIATRFDDVCGVITIPEQNLGGEIEGSPQFSNTVTGEGFVDSETGVITLEYEISGLGAHTDVLTPKE